MTSLSYFRLLQNAVVTGALGLGKQFCLNRQFSEVVWTEMCLQQAFFFFLAPISYTEKVSYSTSS